MPQPHLVIDVVQVTSTTIHKTVMPRQRGSLRSIRDIEFIENSADVITDCTLSEEKLLCDVRICQATRDIAQNGEFTLAQVSKNGCV
jgi:hypothetical protein